jgi:ADP-ribose pyrophosphatase
VRVLLETPRFRVERIETEDSAGRRVSRDVIRHPGSVVILPLVDAQRVCLIRNERIAVDRTLIEAPAGTLDPNEDPLSAAGRELQEETGYRAGKLRLLQHFYPSPGILDEGMHLYLAEDLQPGPPEREPGEQIENLVTSFAEALEMIRDGRIQDAKTPEQ